MIILKSASEIEYMREAGYVAAMALKKLGEALEPGITTAELDAIAESFITSMGAKPSFKGYRGFPASICASVNEEVVHGIPGKRKLAEGDIISIDIGAELHGYHGDNAKTFAVGKVDESLKRLVAVTEAAFEAGLAKAIAGNRIGDIAWAVQQTAEKQGFSVVRSYTGHGIGRNMHEEPDVPNFGRPGHGFRLVPGMTIAIEPMINMGVPEVSVLANGWTVVTKDRKHSSHYEHTIAITEDGPVILTAI